MIGIIIPILVLVGFTLFTAHVTDAIKARACRISCKCGASGTHTIYVVDAVDAVRCQESLTELCPICRCNRLSHRPDPYVEPVAHIETRNPVAPAPRGGRPNRDRKEAATPPGGSINVVA